MIGLHNRDVHLCFEITRLVLRGGGSNHSQLTPVIINTSPSLMLCSEVVTLCYTLCVFWCVSAKIIRILVWESCYHCLQECVYLETDHKCTICREKNSFIGAGTILSIGS